MGFIKGINQSTHYIPSELLDDLCSRFIVNLPPRERWNLVRVCFHVELAHWFYLDNYCNIYKLRPCGQRKFAAHIFQHIPDLRRHFRYLDIVLENWREYKQSIPTYGAILIDEDLSHVLLVQSYHANKSWGFPKGKINEGEEPWDCAAREVLEETGFDISKLINKREYIDATKNGTSIRLYIVANVSRDINFKPRTQKEIKACVWFPIDDLPSNNNHMIVNLGDIHSNFFMVTLFIKKIRRWVSKRKQQKNLTTQETQNDFTQYQDLPTQELQIAYMKYLQRNQPQKLLNMLMENQQQNLSFYKYQDGHLYQVQNSPMTGNNSLVLGTNTSENNLSNLEKYYQQDLPTQQLKNALMICEKQNDSYFEYQESQLHRQEQCSPINSHIWSKNTSESYLSGNESKLATGIRLMKPSEFTSVEKETIPNAVRKDHYCDEYNDKQSNFVAPMWVNFKYDKKGILHSMI